MTDLNLNEEERAILNEMKDAVRNVASARAQVLRNMTRNRRDYNQELDYPDNIQPEEYYELYERSDIAERVVSIFPDECWAVSPEVQETDENEDTEFESAWKELTDTGDLLYQLWRADVLSGIGSYGVMLLGFNDSGDLRNPLPGFSERGRPASSQNRELLYVRSFPHHLVTVDKYETRTNNPRFGLPVEYSIKVNDGKEMNHGAAGIPVSDLKVNWTRVIHLADNRGSSQVFGIPRMRSCFNRLRDLRKILGGCAEMFWKGAFPGYAFEVNPEFVAAAGLDTTDKGAEFKSTMRDEFWTFSEGLQRYLALLGVSAKSLAPQVASPEQHVMTILRVIAMTIGVPFRVFMGSEQGSLASSQDLRTWNRRLRARQQRYLSPLVLRPFIDRLIAVGVLPTPSEKYKISWPDLDVVSEQDKADVADKLTTALQKYVTAKMELFIPPKEYFTRILNLSPAEADIIIAAAKLHRPEVMEQIQEMQDIMAPPQPPGGASNQKPNTAGGSNPRNPASDRTRSGGGASRVNS